MATPQPPATGTLAASDTAILSHIFGLVEAFKAFDADNDGLIMAEELGGILASLGYNASEEEVNRMMGQGDTDGDGLLSAEEFLAMHTTELGLGENLARLLGAASRETPLLLGDQAVTGEELYEAMGSVGGLSLEECISIIAAMDGDGDGAVDSEDFRLILNALL